MKKIVRGNDFTLRIPIKKIVNGEQVCYYQLSIITKQ